MVWHKSGRFEVTIHRGSKLKNVQHGTMLVGKQDPYVKCCLVVACDDDLKYHAQRRQENKDFVSKMFTKEKDVHSLSTVELIKSTNNRWERTQTLKHGGTDPKWEGAAPDDMGRTNVLYFRYAGRDEKQKPPIRLALVVMDTESVGYDREIGSAVIDLEEILAGKTGDVLDTGEIPVQVTGNTKSSIFCTVRFEPWPELCTRGLLHCNVLQGKNLQKVASMTSEDPYVLAELFPWQTRAQTNVCSGAGTNPKWEEGKGSLVLAYSGLANPGAAKKRIGLGLSLTVYDQKVFQSDRPMGKAWIDIISIVEKSISRTAASNKNQSNPKEKEEKESFVEKVQVELFDCQFGVKPTGTLDIELGFEPIYLNEEFTNFDAGTTQGGKKRALLIGINYTGQEGELRGCHNDVYAVQEMLQKRYKVSDFKLLLDTPNAKEKPTADAIRLGLKWLLEGCQPGDKLFLHYSGHGTQVPDTSGDEDDGKDECLVPLDFSWEDPKKQITDDELMSSLFEHLPKGVDLTVLFDCCHSGTLADNMSRYDAGGTRSLFSTSFGGKKKADEKQQEAKDEEARSRYLTPPKNILEKIEALTGTRKKKKKQGIFGTTSRAVSVSRAKSGASIVVISGCRDDQTAADANIGGGKYMGATTFSIQQAMKESGNLTVGDLIESIRKRCKERGWSQVPQLSLGSAKTKNSQWLAGWDHQGKSSTTTDETKEDEDGSENHGDEALPEMDEQYSEDEEHFERAAATTTNTGAKPAWNAMLGKNINYLSAKFSKTKLGGGKAPPIEGTCGSRRGSRRTSSSSSASQRALMKRLSSTQHNHHHHHHQQQPSSGSKRNTRSYGSTVRPAETSSNTPRKTKKKPSSTVNPAKFLQRVESMIESRDMKLKRQREKEAYEAKLDKKSCKNCNITQSYDEFAKRQTKCKTCGQRYRK